MQLLFENIVPDIFNMFCELKPGREDVAVLHETSRRNEINRRLKDASVSL